LIEEQDLRLSTGIGRDALVEDDLLADNQTPGHAAGRRPSGIRVDRTINADFFLRICVNGTERDGDG
jgi:hypothetical protein